MQLTTPIVEVRYRYEVGGKEIYAYDAPVITMSADSELKYAFRGRFYDYRDAGIDFLTDELKVIVSINGDEYNLGYYIITGETLSHQGGVSFYELEGYSRLYKLKQSRIESRQYFAKGTLYTTALYDLLTDANIADFYIAPSTLTLATDREDWEIGTDRLTIINKLLSEMSYASAWVDHDGVIQLTPAKAPSIANIGITYRADRYSIIGTDFTMAVDRHNKPNVFRVVCTNPELSEPLISVIENDSEDNPYSTVYRPRVLTITEVDNIASQSALDDYAYQLMQKSLLSDEVVTFETMLNPEHTVGDIIALGNDELTGIFVETGWTMTLDYQARMTHRARRTVGFPAQNPDETGGGETPKMLSYYGTATPLSVARGYLAGASVGNYALFAGGYDGSTYSSTVDAYDASLTRTTPKALSSTREKLAGASVGNYALFAGGYSGSTYRSTVDAYDASLTRTTPTALSSARYALAGASVGNYALFAGGYGGGSYRDTVDAYDALLTRTTPTALSSARRYLAGASVGNYALFAGGYGGGSSRDPVDAYDASLTHTTPTALSVARRYLAGASVGNYALFAGGHGGGSYRDTVDAYDASLTHTTPTALSSTRDALAGASVGNYALFAGGYGGTSNRDTVDAYDAALTHTTPTALSSARRYLAGASVGDYALFAGGDDGSIYRDTVDVYTVA